VAEEDYNWLVELMEREEHSSLSSIGRKVFRLGRQAIEQAQT
jgi:hypothetical protein